jgi:hypothetical protein
VSNGAHWVGQNLLEGAIEHVRTSSMAPSSRCVRPRKPSAPRGRRHRCLRRRLRRPPSLHGGASVDMGGEAPAPRGAAPARLAEPGPRVAERAGPICVRSPSLLRQILHTNARDDLGLAVSGEAGYGGGDARGQDGGQEDDEGEARGRCRGYPREELRRRATEDHRRAGGRGAGRTGVRPRRNGGRRRGRRRRRDRARDRPPRRP